jgi:glucose-6-phosphate isomerase
MVWVQMVRRRGGCIATPVIVQQVRLRDQNLSPEAIEALAPHNVFEGNRPSCTFLYKQSSPRVLGQLIALYEHKFFLQGSFGTSIPLTNGGVELGKELATDASRSTADLDSSTPGLSVAARKYGRG